MTYRNVLLAMCVLPAAAFAQSLSGHVQDSNGVPVANVDFILSNGAPTGTTNANGDFLITGLSNRTYTIQVDPHNNFLAPQQFDFTVLGATSLGTVVLQPAAPLSATFTSPAGAGLPNVNMNAYLLNGTKLFTPHDGSDVLGNVAISIPLNTPVRVRAVPPVGSNLVPYEIFPTLTGPLALGTIALRQGYLVTGNVVDQNTSLGISGCELTTIDQLTGENIAQQNKLSGALTGAFTLLLPFGIHTIEVVPPVGNLHAARQVFGVIVLANRSLGLVRMPPGANLTGSVSGPGGVVAGADIDVYTPLGDKLFTPNDNTNAAGLFSVMVPFGPTVTYQVRVDPPPALGLVGVKTAAVAFPAATNVGAIALSTGVAFDLTVLDANNAPVSGANLDFVDPVTGFEVITPGDVTDAAGVMHAIVPLGVFDARIDAPQGSPWAPVAFPGVVIAGPWSVAINLPAKNVATNCQGLGTMTVTPGGEVFLRWSFQSWSLATTPGIVEVFVRTPDGAVTPWVPPIYLDFFPLFGMSLDFWVPTPPMTPAEYGRELELVARISDPFTLAVFDDAHIRFIIQP